MAKYQVISYAQTTAAPVITEIIEADSMEVDECNLYFYNDCECDDDDCDDCECELIAVFRLNEVFAKKIKE